MVSDVSQNLGLETVGVKMDKNGAVQVRCSSLTALSSRLSLSLILDCFLCGLCRLMNTLAHLSPQFGRLEMLPID